MRMKKRVTGGAKALQCGSKMVSRGMLVTGDLRLKTRRGKSNRGSREPLWVLKWPLSECSGCAQVKAAAAHPQRLKKNQRKKEFESDFGGSNRADFGSPLRC